MSDFFFMVNPTSIQDDGLESEINIYEFNQSYITNTSNGAWPVSILEHTSQFSVGFVPLNLLFSVQCFVDHYLSFCPFSFGHCIVCPDLRLLITPSILKSLNLMCSFTIISYQFSTYVPSLFCDILSDIQHALSYIHLKCQKKNLHFPLKTHNSQMINFMVLGVCFLPLTYFCCFCFISIL